MDATPDSGNCQGADRSLELFVLCITCITDINLRNYATPLTIWALHKLISQELFAMNQRIERFGLQIDSKLHHFIESEALSGSGVDAEKDLIFKGETQPSDYTEPLLHTYRKIAKKRH